MNNLYRSFLLVGIAACLFLTSCNNFFDEEFIGGKFKRYLDEFSEESDADGYYYIKKSFSTMDNLGIKDQFNEEIDISQPHYYDYRAKATLNDIYATLSMQSDFYGGRIGISCEEKDYEGIEFINRWKDTLFNDGYSLSFEDSLKVNGKMYKDVIVFDGTEGKGDRCIFDKLYFAAKFGLLKIDLLDTISIIRQ